MGRVYSQYTYKDRWLTERMLRDGVTKIGICVILKKHRNSATTEIKNHGMTDENYSALKAQIVKNKTKKQE